MKDKKIYTGFCQKLLELPNPGFQKSRIGRYNVLVSSIELHLLYNPVCSKFPTLLIWAKYCDISVKCHVTHIS
jgi:hypothetical protein